jgi:hypothetical protein
MTGTYENDIHEEIKSRLNSRNACYLSVQTTIFWSPLKETEKDWNIKSHRYSLFCMGVKLDFSCSGKSINSHRDQGGGHQSIGRVI